MKPLGRGPWAGILLAGFSAVTTIYVATHSIALTELQSFTMAPIPQQWLLLGGIAGMLSGGLWVQFTWQPLQAKRQRGRT